MKSDAESSFVIGAASENGPHSRRVALVGDPHFDPVMHRRRHTTHRRRTSGNRNDPPQRMTAGGRALDLLVPLQYWFFKTSNLVFGNSKSLPGLRSNRSSRHTMNTRSTSQRVASSYRTDNTSVRHAARHDSVAPALHSPPASQ